VHELQALRQQLEEEVDIPQLRPLRDETERLEQLLDAVTQLQVRSMGKTVVSAASTTKRKIV
jgi:hypothetical protein